MPLGAVYGDPVDEQANREAELRARVAALERLLVQVTPGPWIYIGASGAPAFLNSFVNRNATTNEVARFRMMPGKMVYVELQVTNPGVVDGTAIWTMPAAFIPPRTVQRKVRVAAGIATNELVQVEQTTGNVTAFGGAGGASITNVAASFLYGL